MKLSANKIILVCCFTALFLACKKKAGDSPTAQKLKAGKWQISACSRSWKKSGVDTTIDYYSQWRACEQDDLLIFYDNGDGAHDENTNKCQEDNQTDPFKWELLDNDRKLHIVLGGKSSELQIVELSDSVLVLRYDEIVPTLGSVTNIETHRNIR